MLAQRFEPQGRRHTNFHYYILLYYITLYYRQELTAGWYQTGVPGPVVVDVAPEAVPAVVRVTAEVACLLQAIVREVLGPETDTATS